MNKNGWTSLLIACLVCSGSASVIPDSRVILGKWVLVNGVYAGATVSVDTTPTVCEDSLRGSDECYLGTLVAVPLQMQQLGWRAGVVLWSDIMLQSVVDTPGCVEYTYSEVLNARVWDENGDSLFSFRAPRTVTLFWDPTSIIGQNARDFANCRGHFDYIGIQGVEEPDMWMRP
jgi:hypothetical protein